MRGGESRRTVQAVGMIAQTLGYYPFAVGMLIQHGINVAVGAELYLRVHNFLCCPRAFTHAVASRSGRHMYICIRVYVYIAKVRAREDSSCK